MDAVLDRITFQAKPAPLTPIPWPKGLEPTLHGAHAPAEIPTADVLVVTYTAAEAQALADVMTPGFPSSAWRKYTTNWSEFEPQLTGRSPARESKCLGVWAVTEIGEKKVVLFKSDLHLSTDAKSLPVRQLLEQLVAEVKPKLVITTGTAGGIGPTMQLGDVSIATAAKFNCAETFKDEPWAQARYQSAPFTAGENLRLAVSELLPVNASKLRPIASRNPEVVYGDVETVDYFGFDDTNDSYGIIKDDSAARMEEMDDAVLPLALEAFDDSGVAPWLSIRNASDPMVSSSLGDLEAQKKWAAGVYAKFGFWTTVGSAIACWAVIADLA